MCALPTNRKVLRLIPRLGIGFGVVHDDKCHFQNKKVARKARPYID
jgi:hypothetical protein